MSRHRYLTKSLIKTALKCPRKMFFAINPNLYPRSNTDDPLLKYLKNEGDRFGEYCKQLFPHGVEIQGDNEHLSKQTHDNLFKRYDKRVTLFEGVVQHESFYARPDIIDKVVTTVSDNNDDGITTTKTELRVIEVKSKSWNSKYTIEEKMMTKKGGILAGYLPYIQDIAFQTMVCRLVYPNDHVSSWLMMPDRAKVMKSIQSSESRTNQMDEDIIPTVEETIQSIDDSIASLLNVDELVEKALSNDVSYPGSKKGETLQTVAYHWAEKLNNDNFGLETFPPTIGAHCSSCEYRIKDPDEKTFSGFDICWQEATGMSIDEVQSTPLIVDLYGNTQKSLKQFLSEDKYTLSALSDRDFDLENDTVQVDSGANKKSVSGHSITRNQRQWYQVETIERSTENDTYAQPTYIIKRNRLKQIMGTFKYPLHFIDFETLSPAIPYYSNMSPYEIFGFQFSHHTLTNDNGVYKVVHASEFLHTEIDTSKSPNVAFLKALYNSIGKADNDGTIFQWSPHETIVLQSMLKSSEAKELSSEEMDSLTNILDTGIVDLCKLAHSYYYVDGSEGSSSIKRLLKPTLNASANLKAIYGSPTYNSNNFKNFQWYQTDDNGAINPYDILSGMNQGDGEATDAITKGGAAAAAYHTLQNNLDLSEEVRKSIEKSLLRYCELDTLAMVMIYQAWEGFINNDDS